MRPYIPIDMILDREPWQWADFPIVPLSHCPGAVHTAFPAGAIVIAGPDFEAAGPVFDDAGPDFETARQDFEAVGPDLEADGRNLEAPFGPQPLAKTVSVMGHLT